MFSERFSIAFFAVIADWAPDVDGRPSDGRQDLSVRLSGVE